MMKTHPGKVTCHALLRVSLYSIDFVALYMNVHCESFVKVVDEYICQRKYHLKEGLKVKMRKSVRNCERDSELQKSSAKCDNTGRFSQIRLSCQL